MIVLSLYPGSHQQNKQEIHFKSALHSRRQADVYFTENLLERAYSLANNTLPGNHHYKKNV